MKSMGDKPKVRIIRMRKVSFIDSTGLHNLESLFRLSEAEHIHMILSGVNEHVHRVLTNPDSIRRLAQKIFAVISMRQ